MNEQTFGSPTSNRNGSWTCAVDGRRRLRLFVGDRTCAYSAGVTRSAGRSARQERPQQLDQRVMLAGRDDATFEVD